jgi:hypothetical protein
MAVALAIIAGGLVVLRGTVFHKNLPPAERGRRIA